MTLGQNRTETCRRWIRNNPCLTIILEGSKYVWLSRQGLQFIESTLLLFPPNKVTLFSGQILNWPVINPKSDINLAEYCTKHMNDLASLAVFGGSEFFIFAIVFSLGITLRLLRPYRKNVSWGNLNLRLFSFFVHFRAGCLKLQPNFYRARITFFRKLSRHPRCLHNSDNLSKRYEWSCTSMALRISQIPILYTWTTLCAWQKSWCHGWLRLEWPDGNLF